MAQINTVLLATAVLCTVFLLLPVTGSGRGTLFRVYNPMAGEICSLLQTEFSMTITALQDGKEIASATFTDHDRGNKGDASCDGAFSLELKNITSWNFQRYRRDQPYGRWTYKMSSNLAFYPDALFGKAVPFSYEVFDRPEEFDLGPLIDASYLCELEDRKFYKRVPSAQNSNVTYTVLVDVKYFHMQLSDVHFISFSRAKKCERP